MTEVRIQPTFDAWRDAARHLLMQHVPPGRVLWTEENAPDPLLPLATPPTPPSPQSADPATNPKSQVPNPKSPLPNPKSTSASRRIAKRAGIHVPRQFVDSARDAACHRDPGRWPLLYRILWRLATSEPDLIHDEADPDVRRLALLRQQVRRDVHKMHAFVRFRALPPAEDPDQSVGFRQRFLAWYEPDHRIVPLAAPFFVERFSTLDWAILTPDGCAFWDGHDLRFGPGISKQEAPQVDDAGGLEALWCTYYASIFNPARIKLGAMKKEMPRRFWKNLPEAGQMDELLEAAPERVEEMMARSAAAAKADAYPTAEAFIPRDPQARRSLPQLAEAAAGCRGCPICELGTRTVFGEGPQQPADVSAVFIGEQPGDNEDREGRPFVGPAGQLLDEALAQVGIDRSRLYVTNAVKHFKYEPMSAEDLQRGKRRIHAKPSAREMQACKPWLVAELQVIKPRIIVALGATAAQSMLGPTFRITQSRGQIFTDTEWSPWWMATLHPSALLRIPDPALREQSYRHFLADLSKAAAVINTTL